MPQNQQFGHNEEINCYATDTIVNNSNLRSGENSTNIVQNELEENPAIINQTFPMSNGENRQIDMKVIEPYMKVISHGGYMHASADGRNVEGSSPAIIIFSACYLPDRSRKDYAYVMDNLFM